MLTIDEILRKRIYLDVINDFNETYFNYTDEDIKKEIDERLETFISDLYDNFMKKE